MRCGALESGVYRIPSTLQRIRSGEELLAVIYGSICSGIEAATVAWHPLGWRAAWYAEIEPFCCALLKHQYPGTVNHGDFTQIRESEPLDVLVGGTPCQSFSVAGKRAGLDDPRGNLTLEFFALARRLRLRWILWENVPGVMSDDGGRTFGTVLGLLAQCGYGFAYRILDAQYFGVPQRRRRVFIVGYLGDWRYPAAVLFERESLRGDITPGRAAREGITHAVAESLGASGRGTERTGSSRGQDPVVAMPLANHHGRNDLDSTRFVPEIATSLNARENKGPLPEAGLSTVTAHSLRAEGFDASEDGTGRGCPIVPILEAGKRCGNRDSARDGLGIGEPGDPMFTLQSGAQHAVMFDYKQSGEIDPVMRSLSHDKSHANSGSHLAVASRTFVGVRRLTPRECERLQGFPDDYTAIPYRGKPCADGPRYRALGNSMAVPVMRWLGERIAMVDAI